MSLHRKRDETFKSNVWYSTVQTKGCIREIKYSNVLKGIAPTSAPPPKGSLYKPTDHSVKADFGTIYPEICWGSVTSKVSYAPSGYYVMNSRREAGIEVYQADPKDDELVVATVQALAGECRAAMQMVQ
jgi:hypothetical protein